MDRYPLPSFPPHLSTLFPKLRVQISIEDANLLDRAVKKREDESTVVGDAAGPNEKLCQAIAQCARRLLASYADYSPSQQALVVGAIYYFLDKEDYLPDDVALVGYDDVRGVMNHVAARLGRFDLIIDSGI